MKILLTGGTGRLGREILKIYDKNKYNIYFPTSKELDIINNFNCIEYFNKNKFNLIIHAAAYTDIKNSNEKFIDCINLNVIGTFNILKHSSLSNTKLVYISTDHVFDGSKGNYSVDDYINPITVYAKSKAASELMVSSYSNSLIIRTSFFNHDYPYKTACIDQYSTKDYIDIMAPKIFEACMSEKKGITHVFSEKRNIFELAKLRKKDVLPCKRSDINVYIPYDTSLI